MARGKMLKGLSAASLLVFILLLPGMNASAAILDDGVYAIDYQLLQADSDSVSIANDYFAKPALLKIKGADARMQVTVNQSEWVKELKAQDGDAFVDSTIVSQDTEANTRVVEFKFDGEQLTPFPLKMHVVIEDMEPVYDHAYTVRVAIDPDSAEVTDEEWIDSQSEDDASGKTIWYIVVALFAVVAIVAVIKMTRSKKKN